MSQNILAFDASTEALSVAIQAQKIIVHFEECPQQHSQKILPTIQATLSQAGLTLADIDVIAFGRGPGSFTGVRIGVSIAQGLAYAANIPVIGISTMQVMAQEALEKHSEDDVFVAIDARMSEIYFAHFKRDHLGHAALVGNEMVLKPDDLDLCNAKGVAVGTGWQAYPQANTSDLITIDEHILLPNSQYMLGLANTQFEQGMATSAEDAQPVYVRDTVTWKKLPGRE